MKKILLLGGSAQQITAIEKAKALGYYTIVCDYLPDNPGQVYANKFYLLSTTDKEAILTIARKEQVNGIVAYASDPAAPTAAYVAEKMALPSNPFISVDILCNKDRFREFLKSNGFNAPISMGYTKSFDAIKDVGKYRLPIIVKPVDSSGSKGVTVLYDLSGLEKAIEFALSFSRSHRFIVEEFIEKKHPYLIGGDIFVSDGKVILWGLMNCHRDNTVNPLVPVGKSYPLELEDADIECVHQTLQELVDKLHIKFGAMNVELIIDKQNCVWPIDIGPRNGGNMIPDLLSMIFNVDVVEMTIRAAMGDDTQKDLLVGQGYYATHNLHSNRYGIYGDVELSPELSGHIIRKNIYKQLGAEVGYFDNAAKALGIIFMKFDSFSEMMNILENLNSHITLKLQGEK